MIKIAHPDLALGVMLGAFKLAQGYYNNSETEGLIPFDVWEQQGMHPALFDSKCAVKMEKGIYVMGSKSHFTWLNQKSQAGSSTSTKKLEALTENRKKRWASKNNSSEKNQNGSERKSEQQNTSEPLTLSPAHQKQEKENTNLSDIQTVNADLADQATDRPSMIIPDISSESLSNEVISAHFTEAMQFIKPTNQTQDKPKIEIKKATFTVVDVSKYNLVYVGTEKSEHPGRKYLVRSITKMDYSVIDTVTGKVQRTTHAKLRRVMKPIKDLNKKNKHKRAYLNFGKKAS